MTDIHPDARPDVRAYLEVINAPETPKVYQFEPPQARELMKMAKAMADVERGAIARVEDFSCPGPAGDIPLRLYDARETAAPAPVICFYHGGGFVIGDLETHDSFCAEMARAMQLPVVAVDYRLAPEAPFPAAPDDCEAATRWIADNGEALGLAIDGLVTCGDSAGGNLAIVVTQQLRERPASLKVVAQFPIYPVVDEAPAYQSFRDFSEGHLLSADSMRWFDNHYAPTRGDPRNACLGAGHHDTPPTLVMTAGLDPLRDQGRAYAAALVAEGATVAHYDAVGNVHGFITLRKALPSSDGDLAQAFRLLKALIPANG